jgi:hypothetical protein
MYASYLYMIAPGRDLYMLCLIIIHIYFYNILFLFRLLDDNRMTGSIPPELSSLTALLGLLVYQ